MSMSVPLYAHFKGVTISLRARKEAPVGGTPPTVSPRALCATIVRPRRHSAATSFGAGAMRDLDRLATAALREAARKKKRLIERDVLARVLDTDQRDAA